MLPSVTETSCYVVRGTWYVVRSIVVFGPRIPESYCYVELYFVTYYYV